MPKCDTEFCHRNAVMEFSFTPGEGEPESRSMCLPCRLALSVGSAVPWGDTEIHEAWKGTETVAGLEDAMRGAECPGCGTKQDP